MLIQALVIFAIINSISAENKFMNSVRNLTKNSNTNQTKQTPNEGNALKVEIAKHLNDCKSDLTYNYYGSQDEGTDKKYNLHRNNKEYKRSDRGNRNFDDGDIDGYLTSYRSNDQNYRNQQKESCSDHDGGRNHNGRGNHGYHRNSNKDGNFGGINYDRPPQGGRNNPYDSRNEYYNHRSGNNDNQQRNYGNPTNYDGMSNYPVRNDDFTRWKREEDNCVSQCVFGYIELLDENSMPSETATIKFLQDHMTNGRKRVKLIRDTRRCFAKLALTEHADGCELSKILAGCLKLNME